MQAQAAAVVDQARPSQARAALVAFPVLVEAEEAPLSAGRRRRQVQQELRALSLSLPTLRVPGDNQGREIHYRHCGHLD